ncbi:MAG TPA: arginine--tRNA ligase [Patescibacteria group bacterium]|nr:arginine--tRNA ligase [Patescibacteria group bacterium]
MKNIVLQKLEKIVKELTDKDIKIELNTPQDIGHGDYTSNVAMRLSSMLGRNPMDIAKEITEKLSPIDGVEKIEIASPGFINFTLTQEYLLSQTKDLMSDLEHPALSEKMEGKKIIVEFTDPNPFKQLHIGHVYSNTIGEAICRLFESQGAEVKRANYQGDVGLHVGKALWGILKMQGEMPASDASLEEKAEFLGKAYATGATAYEENEQAQQEIKNLNKQVYEKDPTIMPLYEKGRAWSLEYFEGMYKRLGMKFDYYYFESVAGPVGLEFVNSHLDDGVFEKSDGAVIFNGEKYGLHTRVFINSQGLPTYEAKELGLAPTKFKEYPYDLSIIITGNEINEYFKVLLKALSLINPQLSEKTRHLSHGMVKLSSGKKMSSRSGQVITASDVLDEAHTLAQEKIAEAKNGKKDLNDDEAQKVAEEVGIGAIKYAFLKSSIGRDIPFSFEESVSFEGNAGPYLQYTFVRTQSILEKAGKFDFPQAVQGISLEELSLLRLINRFEEVVIQAAEDLAPSTVCTYLYELSKNYNLFYQKFRIADASTPEEKAFRLALTQATGSVLKKGLSLLGIAAPAKM